MKPKHTISFGFLTQSEMVRAFEMARTTSFENVNAKIRPFMHFFFWMGQGPSPDAHQVLTTRSKILQMLPITFFVLCNIILFVSGAVLQNYCNKPLGQRNLIMNFYLITELTSNCVVYLQFFINQGDLNNAVREFNEVAQMISLNSGCQPEMVKLFTLIRWKMFFVSITYMSDICPYFLPSIAGVEHLELSVLLDLLQSTTTIACMHGILYTNLLNFYMKAMNNTLIGHSMSSDVHHTMDNDELVFLKKIKMIHFRLWSIAQNVNRFFGCGLGAILLRNFMDTTFAIYWAFLIINNREKLHLVHLIRT